MQNLSALRVHSAEIEEGSTGKREGGSTGKEKEEEYVVVCARELQVHLGRLEVSSAIFLLLRVLQVN